MTPIEPKYDPEKIRSALVERGVDVHTDDLRHCIHEAAHALQLDLAPPWTNDRVHEAAMEQALPEALVGEARARAVERLVMQACNEPYDSEQFVFVTALEFAKYWGRGADMGFWTKMIDRQLDAPEVQRLVQCILAL